jgi:dynein heavy chain 2
MTIHDNIQIVCSMNPSSDIGRHDISTRYTANVRILFIDYPSQEDLKTIYQELAKKILKGFTNDGYTIKDDVIKKIASMLVDLYLNIKEKLTSEAYDHY